MTRHLTIRVRHETRRRMIAVDKIELLTPHMLRIDFVAPDLHDFVSASWDDHIKLFFPDMNGADVDGRPPMRDFTPRSFDTAAGTLTIDFALHEAGPATQWAAAAKVGDTIEIGGPRGSAVIPDDFDWYLLIGDETALPAIGRRMEGLRPGVPVATAVLLAGLEEAQTFQTQAAWTPMWAVRREGEDDAAVLRKTLAGFELPPGEGHVWIAAEATVARDLRTYLIEERGHPREWMKAAGYWSRGQADAHEKIED